MTRYNPAAPQLVGLEWQVDHHADTPLNASPGVAAILASNTAETVQTFYARLNVPVAPVRVQFDFYDAANVSRTDVSVNGAANPPGNDGVGAVSTVWVRSDGGHSTYHAMVDDVQRTGMAPNDPSLLGDYMQLIGTGTTTGWQQALFIGRSFWSDRDTGTPTDPLTNRRCFAIRIRASAECLYGAGTGPIGRADVKGILQLNGATFELSVFSILPAAPQDGPAEELVWEININPQTGFPWTNTDLAGFVSGSNYYGIYGQTFGPTATTLRLYNIQLEVVSDVDDRVAMARQSFSSAMSGWQSLSFMDLDTGVGTSWAKAAHKTYAVVGFKPSGTGSALWRQLVPVAGQVLTEQSVQTWTIDGRSSGVILTDPFAPATVAQGAMAYGLQLGSGLFSADSNVYSELLPMPVDATATVRQDISGQTSMAFGSIGVLCKPSGPTGQVGLPSGPLSLALRRKSDNALIAGPVTVDKIDLGRNDGKLHFQRRAFVAPVNLTSGTAYYIEATSATDKASPWFIGVLSSETTINGNGQLATYRDQTDAASYTTTGGLFRDTTSDVIGSIGSSPPALGSVAAAAHVQHLTTGLTGNCAVSNIGYAGITWASSSLGGTFGGYELQRLDDDWSSIAFITAEGAPFFNDFELPRNTATSYRVRVVRTDSAFSAWTVANNVTVPATDTDILLVSNEFPDINWAGMDENPHTWSYPDGVALVKAAIYGEDGYRAFRPTERRGKTWTSNLIVAFNDPAVPATVKAGEQIFGPLETICHATDIPYVCFADGYGDRHFTAPAIKTATQNEPAGQYLAAVDFFEVTGPDMVTTDTPWSTVVSVSTTYGEPGGTYGDSASTYGT